MSRSGSATPIVFVPNAAPPFRKTFSLDTPSTKTHCLVRMRSVIVEPKPTRVIRAQHPHPQPRPPPLAAKTHKEQHMDQFMKLPPGQKAAVLAAVLAVIGLGMYFLLVDPQLGRAAAALPGDQVGDGGDAGGRRDVFLGGAEAFAQPGEIQQFHRSHGG